MSRWLLASGSGARCDQVSRGGVGHCRVCQGATGHQALQHPCGTTQHQSCSAHDLWFPARPPQVFKAHNDNKIRCLALTAWGDLWTGNSSGVIRVWAHPDGLLGE